jgi:CRISPR-associated exonuclease Cas4
MFSDDQLLPISALQHFVFCQRRAALVHIEGLWSENRFTAEGQIVHQRAHDSKRSENRPGIRIVRGLELRSYSLGLTGKADVVEFKLNVQGEVQAVFPVEYKRGKAKKRLGREFRVQLCAQTLCLEEMMQCSISVGAIYYAKSRQRLEIPFDRSLRKETNQAIEQLHALIQSQHTPVAKYEKKCQRCSLHAHCLPKALKPKATASYFVQQIVMGLSGAELQE